MSDLPPTQDIADASQSIFEYRRPENCWGRLLPVRGQGPAQGPIKRRALNNNDEISIVVPNQQIFTYMNTKLIENDYPAEVNDKYTVSKLLGRGACGEVRLVYSNDNCEKMAMKIVKKKALSLPSNMKIVNCIIHSPSRTSQNGWNLNLEGGEYFDRVEPGDLTESDAKFYFLQMALALQYLHENSIIHRDLKPENLLLVNNDKRCLIKITDFGLSKFLDGNTMLRTFCGTPTYLAPEVLKTTGAGTYTSAVDIWSLGVILYVSLVAYPPFSEDNGENSLQNQIVSGSYSFPDRYWNHISEDAKDLIRHMMEVDPDKRYTIQDVLKHKWLQDDGIKLEVEDLMSVGTVGSQIDVTTPGNSVELNPSSDTVKMTADPLVRKRSIHSDCPANVKKQKSF